MSDRTPEIYEHRLAGNEWGKGMLCLVNTEGSESNILQIKKRMQQNVGIGVCRGFQSELLRLDDITEKVTVS